jgi:hypothetical protein
LSVFKILYFFRIANTDNTDIRIVRIDIRIVRIIVRIVRMKDTENNTDNTDIRIVRITNETPQTLFAQLKLPTFLVSCGNVLWECVVKCLWCQKRRRNLRVLV